MIGRTLGRYRIIEHLGTGGEGSVWKAEHQLLREPRALKFLPESLSIQPAARRRFLNAARAVCRLSHAHVAAAHDADEINGQVFIAYEFVEGESLAQRLKRGPLQMAEAVRLTREAAEGLAHSHSRGVLHRDISSANLMVTREGHIKIVDFGLARVEEFSRATTSDALMGTAAYIAPEVIQDQRWDERCDLYALGVVLYEVLTGKRPFEGQLESQLYQKLHDEPGPPSAHRPDVPQELDRIVLDVLERNPEHRPQSAEALAAELAELAASNVLPAEAEDGGTPRTVTQTPSSSWWNRLARQTRHTLRSARGRRTLAITAISAAAIVVIASMLVWRLLPTSTPTIRSLAVLPLANQSEHPAENQHFSQMGETIATKLAQLSGLRVQAWETTRRFSPESFPDPLDISRRLDVDGLVTGSFRVEGDRIVVRVSLIDRRGFQRWTAEFEGPINDLFALETKVARDLADQVRGRITETEEQRLSILPTGSVDAYEFYLRGSEIHQAGDHESADIALDMYERALEFDPNFAQAHIGIGAVQHSSYFTFGTTGIESLESAENHFRRALDLDPQSGPAQRGLIHVLWQSGRSEEILRIGQEAAKRGWDDPEGLQVRGEALLFGGLYERSIPLFERVIELDAGYAAAYWYRVFVLGWIDRWRELLIAGEQMVQRFGEDSEVLHWMSYACFGLDSLDAFREYHERSQTLESEHRHDLFAGYAFYRFGEVRRANELWTTVVDASQSTLKDYPNSTHSRWLLAMSLAALRDSVRFFDELQNLQNSYLRGDKGFRSIAEFAAAATYLGDSDTAERLVRLALQSDSAMELIMFRQMAQNMFGPNRWREHPQLRRFQELLAEREEQFRALN